MMSLRPVLTTYWSVPPGSRLLALLLLVRFLGGGDLLRAVQQGAQRHPAEHVAMGLLDELHQLADVAVQTLGRRRETERGASESDARQSALEEEEVGTLEAASNGVWVCAHAYMHKCVVCRSKAPAPACEWVASDFVP